MTAATTIPTHVIEAVAEEIWWQLTGMQVPGLTWERCAPETKAWFRNIAAAALAIADQARGGAGR